MDPESVSISADSSIDEDGRKGVGIKIQSASSEINVFLPLKDVDALSSLGSWADRSRRMGTCAGADCFWSIEHGVISILVGHDDETWDFGFWFAEGNLRQLIQEAESVSKSAA